MKGQYHDKGKTSQKQQFIDMRMYVCSYFIQLLEMVIPMKPLAMDIFMGQNGIDIMLLRLQEILFSCEEISSKISHFLHF